MSKASPGRLECFEGMLAVAEALGAGEDSFRVDLNAFGERIVAAKYGPERVEAACERANAFDVRNTERVEDILLQDLRAPAEPTEGAPAQPAPARFARPNHTFRHAQQGDAA